MSSAEAATAHRRFGLGPKPGDLKRCEADPRGFVAAQLAHPAAARLDRPDLQPSHAIFAEVQDVQLQQRLAEAMQKAEQKATNDAARSAPIANTMPASPAPRLGQVRREFFHEDAVARFERAVTTDTPLLERLVLFWSNHFAVSIAKGQIRPIVGAFEREAIRPFVLGRFADMLTAVERHPAMLIYLDNQLSIGPNSQAGRNRNRGLNENLAREILELHTLGVDGGYTQTDVTNLARLITGWTVGGDGQDRIEPGRFLFTPNRHEPGQWLLLGKTYGGRGEASGIEALADLARHPSTARHIAGKLARHFVSDNPPPRLIGTLEKIFRDSDGDLAKVTLALVQSPEAWTAPAGRIVPPFDFTAMLSRSLGIKTKPGEMIRLAGALGQPIWMPPSPKGWLDTDDAWIGPSNIRERFRIAEKISHEIDKTVDPRQLAEDVLGGGMSGATRQAIARAETREQAFELLIMSPEFLRR